MVVTTACKLPSVVGLVVRLMVSEVVVAALTTPIAPLLKLTVFSASVVLNPKPLMVTVDTFAPMLVAFGVTIGAMVATRIGLPLETLLTVTMALRRPADGRLVSRTVREVVLAAITVPTAPLLSVTVLFAAVASKPAPAIAIVVGFSASTVLLNVTVGVTLAT